MTKVKREVEAPVEEKILKSIRAGYVYFYCQTNQVKEDIEKISETLKGYTR